MTCPACGGRGWQQRARDAFPEHCSVCFVPEAPPPPEPAPEAELAIAYDETSAEYLALAERARRTA